MIGKLYNTVLIGSRCWFKENLNVGTMISGVDDMYEQGILEKYCNDDSEANCDTYGALYQWNEMMQYTTTQGIQGICPTGWHIPTDEEWCTMTLFIDPTVDCTEHGWSGTDVGTKMKSITGWNSSGNGTDAFGFTALPGGVRELNGSFAEFSDGKFWTSTSGGTNNAWHRDFAPDEARIDRDNDSRNYCLSVRCVRDIEIPCGGLPAVTDIDGNVYHTVTIGNQCWMKENLKTTKYRNNTNIPYVADGDEWANMTTDAYVWYDKDIMWKEPYGALYNWYATVDTKGLCPTGWHVPTYDEWTVLTSYIGGMDPPHGNELKSCRQINSPLGGDCNTTEHPRWREDTNNGNYGTDDFGFSGLPGGARSIYSSGFWSLGSKGYWWSSSEYKTPGLARFRELMYDEGKVWGGNFEKAFGFSVRCLRDN